ncbi:MAG: polysaccharide biosynthesis C-terminal domain-containing protein, partial [Ruminococcus sp.]|uniref:polysaccharide biosynthesis C-terminal domain-containing protein n=1 Tax=Ruminococcus sp. TaxID=41978 RepID=UPI0025E02C2D
IPPVAAGIFFTSLYNMYSTVVLFYKKTMYIMLSTAIAAVFNIIANYIFIQQFGYVAAAYTTLASFIILSITQYIAMIKMHGSDNIYDEKVFIVLSIVIFAFVIISNFLYSFIILRYLVIFLILFFGVHKRQLIKDTIMEMKQK